MVNAKAPPARPMEKSTLRTPRVENNACPPETRVRVCAGSVCAEVATNNRRAPLILVGGVGLGVLLTMWLGPLGAAVCGAVLLAASRTR